jgi:hypothetical protein
LVRSTLRKGHYVRQKKQRYEITKVPTKLDLDYGLLQGDGKGQHSVRFVALKVNEDGEGKITPIPDERKIEIDIRLTGVSREDGSGKSWCFKGYTTSIGKSRESLRVNGSFRTDCTVGHLHIEL